MRGMLAIGLTFGLLISSTAIAAGGTINTETPHARAHTLILPNGVELTDAELERVNGEFLPVWAALVISLAARAGAAVVANAVRGALIGAPSGVLPEVGAQLGRREFDARALGCAALGGAIAGAIGGPLAPGAKTVSGSFGLAVGGYSGSRCGQ